MREILFRGKRLDNGEWVQGCYVKAPHQYSGFIKDYISVAKYDEENECGKETIYLIDPETVCQFTGVTDKRGKKIWENDILSEDWAYFKGIVRFGNFEAVVLKNIGFNIEWKDEIYYRQDLAYWAEKCEVIGNIFDNPDLLKGGVADET